MSEWMHAWFVHSFVYRVECLSISKSSSQAGSTIRSRVRNVTTLSPQGSGEEVTGEQLHEILKEIDTNMNGQVELDEYLQVYIAWLIDSYI